jgi:predicted O-methyltransferase YrrM
MAEVVRGLTSSGPIIEIGTLFGYSTMVLAMSKEDDRKLITVDAFNWNPLRLHPDNHAALTQAALQEAVTSSNVTIVRQDKDEFFSAYQGAAPALVFIDADHDYEPTLRDIRAAQRLGAEVICGHDYGPEFPGVGQAVEESGGLALLCETFWVLRGTRSAKD